MSAPPQDWNAADYAANARFVADLADAVVELLDPRPGERILDLGCGDGALTARIAAAGARVTGIDGSPDMVAAARARGLDAHVIDGQALALTERFDAVFTNAALHWMPDAAAVLRGVARVLKPGGRFVGEFGGHGNIAAIATALRAALGPEVTAPWFYPTDTAYRALLEAHGFTVRAIALHPRRTPLPTGLRGWLATFRGPVLRSLPEDEAEGIVSRLEQWLAPSLRDENGVWIADYVRLRFAAEFPG